MKFIKFISWFLGISMFIFGVLKFIDPFKGWYAVQVNNSNLGDFSYAMGITGEITAGICMIFALLYQSRISPRLFTFLIIGSSAMVAGMMATGIYVHFHPDVPAGVLPLKIKPPFIPGTFFFMAALNAWLMVKKDTPSLSQ